MSWYRRAPGWTGTQSRANSAASSLTSTLLSTGDGLFDPPAVAVSCSQPSPTVDSRQLVNKSLAPSAMNEAANIRLIQDNAPGREIT